MSVGNFQESSVNDSNRLDNYLQSNENLKSTKSQPILLSRITTPGIAKHCFTENIMVRNHLHASLRDSLLNRFFFSGVYH